MAKRIGESAPGARRCLTVGGALALGWGLVAPAAARAETPAAALIVAGVTAAKVATAQVSSKGELKEAVRAEESVSSAELEANSLPAELLPSRLELTAGTDGLVVLSNVSKQVSLFAEARYRFTRMLQFGGSLAYRFQAGDDASDSAFQLLLGPTFNFGSGLSLGNAYFVSPQVGFTTGQTKFGSEVVGSNTQATFGLHAGKRFQIGQSVSYAPSIGVVKEWSFGPSFVVQPIALSVFF